MKIDVNEDGFVSLTEVYNPMYLTSEKGERIVLQMRDSGFEFSYNGVMYSAKKGKLQRLDEEITDSFELRNKHIELL